VVADDTPDGLRARSFYHGAVSISFSGVWPENIVRTIEGLPEVRDCQPVGDGDGKRLRVFPKNPGRSIAESVLSASVANGAEVSSFYVEQGRLDEVFRSITTDVKLPGQTA
jgi:ABC-2 type transport system ATP-binding protein